ncbi:hypothetical protein K461DRAFT_283020 [Myriangium duriaei CBS 260.36]|uniref:T6SS Phospholipase effector Tle1-like catalytic domain-containing protein n=1 Tax=Myriangium duriaei CBS 260.36 TaxID=1168546 RepID=A0A9P4IR76_9PEZI|nr:hypothetical protein K461DRAFT_283020 [Myriangium duriaei CBS 260.36]
MIANISEPRRIKKLVVCCDGTWLDSAGGRKNIPSNVTRLARAITPTDSDGTSQIVYYQAGIGTGLGMLSQFAGGGTGLGFSENVREAYAFLANNFYQEPDRSRSDSIFLIGFSRGAYTARSLGGLVGQLGLLKKESMSWFYDVFRDWQNAGNPDYTPTFWQNWSDYQERLHGGQRHSLKTTPSNDIRQINEYLEEYRMSLLSFGLTQEAEIAAVGVFDTVGALGIPVNPLFQKIFGLPSFLRGYKWVDTALDNHVRNAFHALALDEHRAPFFPAVWERPEGCTTNLKQVWFAGAHSNIGSAYSDIASGNLTLAWMMDHLAGDELRRDSPTDWNHEQWLQFDIDFLKEQRLINLDWQKREGGGHRRWGLGTIYNSLTFPQVLAGWRTRKPGRTHPVRYDKDYTDTTRLLRNTNERIHASVRIRTIRAGPFYEPDPDANLPSKITFKVMNAIATIIQKIAGRGGNIYYDPMRGGPLRDWELKDGFKHHDKYSINVMDSRDLGTGQPPYWQYTGNDPLLKDGTTMPEDELGTFERVVLKEYVECAEWVEASNSGKVVAKISPDQLDDLQRRSATM